MRALTLLITLVIGLPLFADEETKPNVIVIFTDDQGTIDANCFGASDLRTPGIDRLAERGVKFTQFYAAAPVCSPSRAGLLTGRYPVRAGVPGNMPSTEGKPGMPTEQVTMAEVFKAAGYATAHIGKWHLGYTPETMPNGQGFDYSFGHMGGCIDNFSHFFYWNGPNRHDLWRNGKEVHERGYFPDLMLDEAKEWIGQQNKPFFIYFALNCPHYPYQGEPEFLETFAELPYPRNLYAAFVASLDARIDDLQTFLDEEGLTENTVLVFQSDHGHSCEQRAHFGGGSSGPHRGAKFSLFEGGIRVPAVISWKGALPEGTTSEVVAHSCDWLPTLAELCGLKLDNSTVDGRSLVDVIKGGSESPHGVLHWTIGNSWAVRDGDWKLIGNPKDTNLETVKVSPLRPDDRLFLVNIADDPAERRNVALRHPDVTTRLKRLHDEWVKTLNP